MTNSDTSIGNLLRGWRQRRRLSQLDLATEAEISQRHLSFVESGRSLPSREMVLLLSEHLRVPLRERNLLLVAAGYAPSYQDRTLEHPDLEAARNAVELILKGHEPYPALAIDRHWRLVAANRTVPLLLKGVDAALLEPPVNVLRLSLHPNGLAPRILNFREWRAHVLGRLVLQVENSADATLGALVEELKAYPTPLNAKPSRPGSQDTHGGIAVPLALRWEDRVLSFLTTTSIFGTALDITLSEIAIESFFPADSDTSEAIRELSRSTELA